MSLMIRVNMTIINNYKFPVKCVDISCGKFNNMSVGTSVGAGKQETFNADLSLLLFCAFEEEQYGFQWEMGMGAIPFPGLEKTKHACGYTNSGLQRYEAHDNQLNVTYRLGEPNLASWSNSDYHKGMSPSYGHCKWPT